MGEDREAPANGAEAGPDDGKGPGRPKGSERQGRERESQISKPE